MRLFLAILFLITATPGKSQQTIPLYEGDIPGAKPGPDREISAPNELVDTVLTQVSRPTLTLFLPEKGASLPQEGPGAGRMAVIICPGGGYHALLIEREGRFVAREFNKAGIAAVVLKYRLPHDRIMEDKASGPLRDAQQAIRVVREHAAEWGIDPAKIGIMGFSAGGHLAATAGTHFDKPLIENAGSVSLRPDFMLLINPVISFTDSIGHKGSRDNLLGPSPSGEQIRFYSAELGVTEKTPPAFLVHSAEDVVVPPENSLYFYRALRNHHVPAAIHLYGRGEHGFLTAPDFEEWFGRCLYWLRTWQEEQDRAG
ncbi:acetyl esterase/lipase [Anseongella ginsenosidimutans]|uniref:Acetyl esterase/lipase n=1 Tax=Anseongella ginsenosidimutans TaxID=496056 RepID=A0A4R3KW09_9SPHI|nr:alpha/beta hydrolase [Anseongella ginsenosidimutans]QEC51378.1 alpha/beta hydrolase [Anseongella ginsenosidimutans]TCS89917.1 acetyl esterase/lipase [Anseongella ginsenosidimutans]